MRRGRARRPPSPASGTGIGMAHLADGILRPVGLPFSGARIPGQVMMARGGSTSPAPPADSAPSGGPAGGLMVFILAPGGGVKEKLDPAGRAKEMDV